MEGLNNQQLILLALLVSFVTSIATGIVTVTLMEQVPTPITQTINRVVERTIERVVPDDSEPKTTTVIREVPVIVTEEQLVVEAVNGAMGGVVRILDENGQSLGNGFLIKDSSLVLTSVIPTTLSSERPDILYTLVFENGETAKAKYQPRSDQAAAVLETIDGALPKTATGLVFAAEEAVPGQTVIALGRTGDGPIQVSGGIISSVFDFEDTATSTNGSVSVGRLRLIQTNAINVENLGGPLLNIKGEVVGLNRENGVAVAAALLRPLVDKRE